MSRTPRHRPPEATGPKQEPPPDEPGFTALLFAWLGYSAGRAAGLCRAASRQFDRLEAWCYEQALRSSPEEPPPPVTPDV